MIELQKKLQTVNTPQEEKILKMQIDNIDEQINARVYQLYGLTDDEIDIIEELV